MGSAVESPSVTERSCYRSGCVGEVAIEGIAEVMAPGWAGWGHQGKVGAQVDDLGDDVGDRVG